jgi:hypothetical protein
LRSAVVTLTSTLFGVVVAVPLNERRRATVLVPILK